MIVVSLVGATQPAMALTPLLESDVAAFSSRAQQWTDAREVHRDAAHEQALRIAEDARQVEAERLAADEAAQVAALAARTTTTSPPTTVPPTTSPPTTVPPTTVPPTTEPTTEPTTTESTTTESTTEPTPTEPPTTASPAGPTAAQWQELRRCESSGNYGAVSANGRFRGAYQFSQATWDWVAGTAAPSLIGVDPAAATPGDQDWMALVLWNRQGWAPWPHCGALAAAV